MTNDPPDGGCCRRLGDAACIRKLSARVKERRGPCVRDDYRMRRCGRRRHRMRTPPDFDHRLAQHNPAAWPEWGGRCCTSPRTAIWFDDDHHAPRRSPVSVQLDSADVGLSTRQCLTMMLRPRRKGVAVRPAQSLGSGDGGNPADRSAAPGARRVAGPAIGGTARCPTK